VFFYVIAKEFLIMTFIDHILIVGSPPSTRILRGIEDFWKSSVRGNCNQHQFGSNFTRTNFCKILT